MDLSPDQSRLRFRRDAAKPLERVLQACWLALIMVTLAPVGAHAQEAGMTHEAKGEFTVAIRPLELEGAAGSKRGRMTIDKQITGDLIATTRGQMLTAMTAVPGSAVYVAIEEVSGTLHGRSGSFVLHHRGVMDGGAQALSVSVVPDSGTGELSGLRGEFQIRIEEGKHFYTFSYSLPGAQQ